jgi:hypothetical protein
MIKIIKKNKKKNMKKINSFNNFTKMTESYNDNLLSSIHKLNLSADEYYDLLLDKITVEEPEQVISSQHINNGLRFKYLDGSIIMIYNVYLYITPHKPNTLENVTIYRHLHTDFYILHKNDKDGIIFIKKLQQKFPNLEVDIDSLVLSDDIGN